MPSLADLVWIWGSGVGLGLGFGFGFGLGFRVRVGVQLGGHVEEAEEAVLGVLRDEVALRAAEEDDDRVEGPHGGGEHLQVAEELLH